MRRNEALAVVLAVLCALVGALLLTRPEDAEIDAPAASMHYVEAYGRSFCTCTPMADGCYTAKHCFTPPVPLHALTVDGVPVPGIGFDPSRDLAHIPLFADPSVRYGKPTERVTWYGMRHGTARLLKVGDVRGPYTWPGGTYTDRQTYDAWCYARDDLPLALGIPALGPGEDRIRPGDSGGGFYNDAGELVGILSLFDSRGCGAWTVRVP